MNAPIDISAVTLRTPRMTLRPWRETDVQDFYCYAKVDGVGQMAGWAPHRSIEESGVILENFIRGKKTFALEYNGKVIGSLGIEKYSETNYPELAPYRGRELGYVLSRDYWGKGLMPEAAAEVIRYLFDTEKLDFLLVGHFEWNRQSARVIEKCGFRYLKTTDFVTRFNTVERTREYILLNDINGTGCSQQIPVIYPLRSDELAESLSVIHESFRTVAEEFGLTKENCPKHTSFIPISFLEAQMKWGWQMFGLFSGKQIIGYFSLSKENEEAYELHNLAVLPQYRHKGFGKKLLEYAKQNLIDHGGNILKVRIIEESCVLKEWYLANGFKHTGKKKFPHLPFTTGYLQWQPQE